MSIQMWLTWIKSTTLVRQVNIPAKGPQGSKVEGDEKHILTTHIGAVCS